MTRRSLRLTAAAVLAFLGTHTAAADDLSTSPSRFGQRPGHPQPQADQRRHDTDYIQAGGALGRLPIRFRTTPNGDWRELRERTLVPQAGQSVASATCSARGSARWRRRARRRGGGRRRVARVERRAGPQRGGRRVGAAAAWRWSRRGCPAARPCSRGPGARRDAVGAVHAAGSLGDFARRGFLGQRTGQRRDAGSNDCAALVACPLPGTATSGNQSTAQGPYGVEANTFTASSSRR